MVNYKDHDIGDHLIVISGGGQKTEKLDNWRHWEIVGDLVWRGVNYVEAYDLAKWARRAEKGQEKRIGTDILIKVK